MSDPETPPAADSPAKTTTIADQLRETPALKQDRALVDVAARVFEFTQFLLDDDENLTRVGNLNGTAKDRLRARALELLGVEGEAETTGATKTEATADAGEATTSSDGSAP